MIRLFHRHRYDLRETRSDGRYLVCSCGHAVPMLKRDEAVRVTPPAHESMKARPAEISVIYFSEPQDASTFDVIVADLLESEIEPKKVH